MDGSYKVRILFHKTGYERTVRSGDIRTGKIKDHMRPSVYGVGYIGFGAYSKLKYKKIYDDWCNMLCRCYSSAFHSRQKTYIECSVHPDWHNFQTFAEWHTKNYTEGMDLDKDLLIKGNLIYSEKTCVFVTRSLNTLFNKSEIETGDLIGSRAGNKYSASINIEGNKVSLGNYMTKQEAHNAWKKAKAKEIIRQSLLPTTPDILIKSLESRAEELRC